MQNLDDLLPRLRLAAIAYLQTHPTSAARVKQVLQRRLKSWKTDPLPEIQSYINDTLIPELGRLRLLDDTAFARGLAESYTRKGYATPMAQEKARKYGVNLPQIDDRRALLHVLRRKKLGAFAVQAMPAEMVRKHKASLARRGFSSALINECLAMDEAAALEYLAS